MITDTKQTEWLYYYSPYSDALDNNEYSDPKFLELNFPYRDEFCEKLQQCNLEDFVSTMVWMFKDKFPIKYTYVESKQMLWDDINNTSVEGTNVREDQDIEPLEFIEDEDVFGYLISLKITFKQAQPLASNWIDTVIANKSFSKTQEGATTHYTLEDSPIETIEVTNNYVLITIDQDKIDDAFER